MGKSSQGRKSGGGGARTPAQQAQRDTSCGVIPVHVVEGVRRYLLIQHHAGHWGFPKGHPEKGETELEAARRELREETGVAEVELLERPRLSESYFFRGRGRGRLIHKTVAYFIGLVRDPRVTPQPEEIHDFAWGTFDETMDRLSFKEGKRILGEAERFLSEQAV